MMVGENVAFTIDDEAGACALPREVEVAWRLRWRLPASKEPREIARLVAFGHGVDVHDRGIHALDDIGEVDDRRSDRDARRTCGLAVPCQSARRGRDDRRWCELTGNDEADKERHQH